MSFLISREKLAPWASGNRSRGARTRVCWIRPEIRFAPDSPPEESGFEPLVPRYVDDAFETIFIARLHSHSCLRGQLVHREGPTVRIRFPPAGSPTANLLDIR